MTSPILVHPTEARRQFQELAAGEIGYDDLARGALLIALEDAPSLDVEATLAQIDALADRAAERYADDQPPLFRLGALQSVLFDDEGFMGDTENYYDIRNSFLHETLERKRGLPITLSILFIHAARRLRLDAVGIGLPAHFVARIDFDLSSVYVDPFGGGDTLTLADLEHMIRTLSNGQLVLEERFLRPWTARRILTRVLTNMQNSWTRAGDGRRAASAAERIALLQSRDDPHADA